MNLQTISSELAELIDLIAQWEQHSEIPDIEREIALDKMKVIYMSLKKAEAKSSILSEKLAVDSDMGNRKLQGLFYEVSDKKEEALKPMPQQRKQGAYELEELVIPDFPIIGGRSKESEEKRLTAEEAAPILDAISSLAGSINSNAKPSDITFERAPEPILELEHDTPAAEKKLEPIKNVASALEVEPKVVAPMAEVVGSAEEKLVVTRFEDRVKVADKRLGEVIASTKSSLNEVVSPKGKSDLATKLQQKPVEDLHKAISFNDKFRLIRTLFGGDGRAYDAAINALNGCTSIDEALIYIQEHYSWDAALPEVNLLVDLLQRRFL